MSSITHALLYVEHEPEGAECEAFTATVAAYDGVPQRFSRLDSTAAGGAKAFQGAVYAAAFSYVSNQVIEAFVSQLPMRGDVVLYIRNELAERPILRIREDVREAG